ncbi:OprO/OprP family phosphate-selective porin [bacterium]|nr:OprO/OprP family phosphate-selective porin [bacterium]MBU4134716.1 OprO/OprP family phosphate-selective porin [bacterium]
MKKLLSLCLVLGFCAGAFAEDVKVGCYIHSRFSAGKAENDSFAIKRARVKFTGNLDERFSFQLLAETAVTPLLLDAYMECKMSDALKIKTGQFKIPLSAEALASATKQDLINKYQFISQMLPSTCRDIGVMASGEFPENKISYSAGVFNGSGPNAADNDGNSFYVARLTAKPLAKIKAGVGFAGSHETVSGDSKIETALIATPGFASYEKQIAQADLEFKQGGISLKAEYIAGNYSPDDSTIKGVNAAGFGVTGSYFVISKKLQASARYEKYDPDDSVTDKKDVTWTTLGLNYFPAGKVKLQANYISKKEAKNEVDNDTLIVQLQYCF